MTEPNSVEIFNIRVDQAEERNQLEDKLSEIIQPEEQRLKKNKKE